MKASGQFIFRKFKFVKPEKQEAIGSIAKFILVATVVLGVYDISISSWNCNDFYNTHCINFLAPTDHYSIVLTTAGLTIALLLTYLSIRGSSALSIGQPMLRNAIFAIRSQQPVLYAIFDQDALSRSDNLALEEFIIVTRNKLDDALLDAPEANRDRLDTALKSLLFLNSIYNFSKLDHQRNPSIELPDFHSFGFGRFRAAFMLHILGVPNREISIIFLSNILVGVMIFYINILAFLDVVGFIDMSFLLLLIYPFFAAIAMYYILALSFRLWPQPSLHDQLEPLSSFLKDSLHEDVMNALDSIPKP